MNEENKPIPKETPSPKNVVEALLNIDKQVINNFHSNGEELIPLPVLIALEQVEPGYIKKYADELIAEPSHRRNMEERANLRADVSLYVNLAIYALLVGSGIYFVSVDKMSGALGTLIAVIGQYFISAFMKVEHRPTVSEHTTQSKKKKR